MTQSELEELLKDCPRLYHTAERGAWAGVQAHGLLSVSALLDLYKIEGRERTALESQWRRDCIPLRAAGLPGAIIRDQHPMSDAGLIRCLPEDITPQQWYECLNQKVFLWLNQERLLKMTDARPYRHKELEVYIFNTRAIVEAHREKILLCPLNSGCTYPYPAKRDFSSFASIADYPYAVWRKKRKRGERAVEFCIEYALPDAARFIEEAYIIRGRERLGPIG